MAREKNVSINFGGLLPVGVFLVFLFLKLAEVGQVATWSWWWVTSPLWIPCAIALAIIAVAFFFYVFILTLTTLFKGK